MMTWKEFKDLIDKQMKEKGIDENTEVWYIDISFPNKESVGVSINKEEGIYIW